MNLGAAEVLTILVVVTGVVAFLICGNRPSPEQFAAANSLELDDATRVDVDTALRRTYRGRLLGGCAGFVVAVVFAALGGTSVNFTGGLAAILAGTLLGIALAQFTHTPKTGALRIASLETRDPDDYRPHRAKTSLGIALVVLVTYAGALIVAEVSGRVLAYAIVVPSLAVASVVIGVWLQRRIVEHAQVPRDPGHARVDAALRASAVRAVHHATLGIVLCGAAFLGVTGASWTTTEVLTGSHVAFEIPGATNVATIGHRIGSTDSTMDHIFWTDVAGVRHSRPVPGLSGYRQSSDGLLALGGLLAVFAGFGALLEWRAAARAWKEPGPRRRHSGATSTIATAGAAS